MNGYTAASEDAPPVPRGYPYYSTEHTYSEDTVHSFTLPRPELADSSGGNVRDEDHIGEPAV